jgi:hypothetical protein
MAETVKPASPLTPTGAKAAANVGRTEHNIGQPEIRMKEAPKERKELGKGIREHVEGIMKQHEPADPNLPSLTEVAVRALSLRCLQLLAEAEALAAQIELYEVPEEDDERRKEGKKQKEALAKSQAESAKKAEKV